MNVMLKMYAWGGGGKSPNFDLAFVVPSGGSQFNHLLGALCKAAETALESMAEDDTLETYAFLDDTHAFAPAFRSLTSLLDDLNSPITAEVGDILWVQVLANDDPLFELKLTENVELDECYIGSDIELICSFVQYATLLADSKI